VSNQKPHQTKFTRVSVAESWRRGWEDARKGKPFDSKYHDSLTDQYCQSNYELDRLTVIEGKRLGLTKIPTYAKLSSQVRLGIMTKTDTKVLMVKHLPSIQDYAASIAFALLDSGYNRYINPTKQLKEAVS
jgi:hypothetical protein